MYLRPDERAFYCGKTGSGKSFLAKQHLKEFERKHWRIVIVDKEGMWMGKRPDWERSGPGTVDKPRLVNRFDPKLACQLYIPSTPAYDDAGLEALCNAVLAQGDTIFYCDELIGVADTHHQNAGFLALWAQGRKHNVSARAASQRPARIPEHVMSQSENWFVFRLANRMDRKRVADYTDSPQIEGEAIPSRNYWYYHAETMDTAQLMRPYDATEAK